MSFVVVLSACELSRRERKLIPPNPLAHRVVNAGPNQVAEIGVLTSLDSREISFADVRNSTLKNSLVSQIEMRRKLRP